MRSLAAVSPTLSLSNGQPPAGPAPSPFPPAPFAFNSSGDVQSQAVTQSARPITIVWTGPHPGLLLGLIGIRLTGCQSAASPDNQIGQLLIGENLSLEKAASIN